MTITNEQKSDILKVYMGLFNAAPGNAFLTESVTQVEGGTTIAQLADDLAANLQYANSLAANSRFFSEGILEGKVTTAAQVDVLMNNFGVSANIDPTSAGSQASAFFTDRIDAGVGLGAIVLEAVKYLSGSVPSEFTEAATLLANKVKVAEAYSITHSSSDLSTLQNVVKNVTGTAPYNAADVAKVLASVNDAIAPTVTADHAFTYIEAVNHVGPINDINDVIGKVSATDNSSVTNFAITAGNNEGFFAIDSQGQITLTAAGLAGAANNFEAAPKQFALVVIAEDSAKNISVGQPVIITVTDNTTDNTPDNGGGPASQTFTLTTGNDNFAGAGANDTFNATYNAGVVTDTFNNTDILAGNGGTDTLNISHLLDVAITPPDALWTGITGIEKVVINTTGSGAQTITTGGKFDNAFKAAGVDLTTKTSGAGAITMTMTSFTGAAAVTTESLAGAQTIVTGSAATTVNATSNAGALTINGTGLTTVTAVTTGAGAQTIGGAGAGQGGNLVLVNATAFSGAQTITSTSASNVTVNTTTGAGALTIVTGAGNDTITLTSTDAAGANTITSNAGADTITLATGLNAAGEIVVIGNTDSGITLATADRVTNFATTVDKLQMVTAGTGTNYTEAAQVADFATALAAANTAMNSTIRYHMTSTAADGGLLFVDSDLNGTADSVVKLTGLSDATFAFGDITTITATNNISDIGGGGGGPVPQTFTLTTGNDSFVGGAGVNDTFNGLFTNGNAGNTFKGTTGNDILNGSTGTDTLNIAPALAGGPITLADVDFAGVSGMENLVFADTAAGAQTFTLGTNVNAGFVTGMNLKTTSTGGGTTLTMSDTTIAETVTINSTTGINTVTTGSGLTTLNVTSAGVNSGAITITSGATSTAANTITTNSTNGVQAITTSNGNQTINATATIGGVTVTTATGTDSITVNGGAGAVTATTGAGNDSITVTAATGAIVVTAGAGADAITLVGGHAGGATINYGTLVTVLNQTGATLATADSITGFNAVTDQIKTGTAGTGTNYAEAGTAASFAAASIAADAALDATVLYYLTDTAADGGLLFVDSDSNGSFDAVIQLAGVTSASFGFGDITA